MATRGGGLPSMGGALGAHLSERQRAIMRRVTPVSRTRDEQTVEAGEGTFDMPAISRPKGARLNLYPRGGGLPTTLVTYMGAGRYSKKTGRRVS